jgi:hypothetical protein
MLRRVTFPNYIAVPLAVKQFSLVPGLPMHKQEFCSPSLQPSLRCKTHAFLPPDFATYKTQSYHDNSCPSIWTFFPL